VPFVFARKTARDFVIILSMNYTIRPILPQDNLSMENIIKLTMTEFGASGEGFSINDPEVLGMFEAYTGPWHAYFVITDGKDIFGGAGIAPLTGGDPKVCELRKMYFSPEIRGQGLGQALMDKCLVEARQLGFEKCYLETLKTMTAAEKLYVKSGFKKINSSMGATGHFSCDSFYLKTL
jgi:putative acetyltransferase